MKKGNLNNLLLSAVKSGDVVQVKELLAANADPNTTKRIKAVYTMSGYWNERALTEAFFLHPNSKVPPFPATRELSQVSKEIITLLLEAGADLNPKASEEETISAIHLVAESGIIDILNLMLKYNLDVNLPDVNGGTPLHIACRRNQIETVIILIGAGANVNAKDDNGFMPIASSRKGVKELLLRAGVTYQEMPPPAPNPFL